MNYEFQGHKGLVKRKLLCILDPILLNRFLAFIKKMINAGLCHSSGQINLELIKQGFKQGIYSLKNNTEEYRAMLLAITQ